MAEYIPTDIVQKLAATGKSEQEIAAELRLRGFTPSQIDKALKEAIKMEVSGPQPLGMAPEPSLPATSSKKGSPEISAGQQRAEISRHPTPPAPPASRQPVRAVEQLPIQPMSGPMGEPPEKVKVPIELKPVEISENPLARQFGSTQPSTEISLEELVEAIVNERWVKFEEKLSVFDKRDLNLQQQIQDMKKQIGELGQQREKEEKMFMEKLEEFGEGIEKTQSRIGSIEGAFKEFVPTLAENVKSLADVVDRLKKSK